MSRQRRYAQKLMRVNLQSTNSDATTPSAIFGTIGSVAQKIQQVRPAYRIGWWPCIADQQAEVSNGFVFVLSYLLEHWRDVQIYRLPLSFEDEAFSDVELNRIERTPSSTQFTPDDWTLDSLDENIAIWSTLKHLNGILHLNIYLENDLITEDEQISKVEITANDWSGLLAQLPSVAKTLAEKIGLSLERESDPSLPAVGNSAGDIDDLLKVVYEWELLIADYMSDVEIEDEEVIAQFDALLDAGKGISPDLASWITGYALRQLMRPGLSVLGDVVSEELSTFIEQYPESSLPAIVASDGLFDLGYSEECFELLEQQVVIHPDSIITWLKLAEFYAMTAQISEAIETLQDAISHELKSVYLFRLYGNVLQIAGRRNISIEEALYSDDLVSEAIQAYENALDVDSFDKPSLLAQGQLLASYDPDDERIWRNFGRLLNAENSQEQLRDLIDNLQQVEDVREGIRLIEGKLKDKETIDLYTNLALLHLANDSGLEAVPYLEKALAMTTNVLEKGEIERLLLVANDPEFEFQLAEIISVVDAGNSPSADDIGFVEDAIENAPHMIDGYLALGRAYDIWGDYDAAIEVLLDAQEKMPDQPLVLDLLAVILAKNEQYDLAIEYLQRGLTVSPDNISLLTRVALLMFDLGYREESKGYMLRSEEIAPNSDIVASARAYIARKLASE